MAQMGPILPPKTKLFPRREMCKRFQKWGEKGPIGPFRAQIADCLISCR